ncbi:MAG TPA: hypothetical protein VF174_15645 [Micromonosporaceae bacterium]
MPGAVMASGRWVPLAELSVVVNHPGHSSQKSHGRKGGDWESDHNADSAALKAAAESALKSSTPLGGGFAASVKIEEHEGGSLVRKDFPPSDAIRAPKDQADSEVLGSKVAAALGVPAPAVVAVGEHSVIMEVAPGKTWAEGGRRPLPDEMVDSDQGRMLGLHDVLIGNHDRNSTNFMVDDDGGVTAIDHGLAFGWSIAAGTGSPFARHFSNAAGDNWADSIDISPGDMRKIRGRLDSLKADFDKLGRSDWHAGVMERLDALEPRATGERDRLS